MTEHAVLVHGDIHDLNALQAADGTFKLVDPGGLRAERACDLGTIIRCNPDAGDDLHARAKRLAARTGVDATAIWEWGTIHRVIGGLYSRQIGFQPFGDLLLAEADRLATPPARFTANPAPCRRPAGIAPTIAAVQQRSTEASNSCPRDHWSSSAGDRTSRRSSVAGPVGWTADRRIQSPRTEFRVPFVEFRTVTPHPRLHRPPFSLRTVLGSVCGLDAMTLMCAFEVTDDLLRLLKDLAPKAPVQAGVVSPDRHRDRDNSRLTRGR